MGYEFTLQEFMEKMDNEGGLYEMYRWGGDSIVISNNEEANRVWQNVVGDLRSIEVAESDLAALAGEWWLNTEGLD